MRHVTLLAVFVLACAALARAESFPSKNIRLVTAAAPGGGVDTTSRIIAQNLQEAIGRPGVVDNRPGAGGSVGGEIVATAAPDGHTLLTISISHAVLPSSHKHLPYKPDRDLVPVTIMVNAPNVLVANASLPVKSVKELIEYAKQNPGRINYASSGNASPSHLATEYLKLLTGIDLVHVPYKGTGPGMTDVVAGRASLMFAALLSAKPHVDAGKLRILATAGSRRAAAAPDVPTIAEAGVPGYAVDVWYAMLAPAATPRPTLERLNRAVAEILRSSAIEKKLASLGLEPVADSLAASDAYMKSEIAKWARVVKAAHITSN